MEVVQRVSTYCAEQYAPFFGVRRDNDRQVEVNIMAHGIGGIIGAKLGLAMSRPEYGAFHVHNIFGNFTHFFMKTRLSKIFREN